MDIFISRSTASCVTEANGNVRTLQIVAFALWIM